MLHCADKFQILNSAVLHVWVIISAWSLSTSLTSYYYPFLLNSRDLFVSMYDTLFPERRKWSQVPGTTINISLPEVL